MGLPLILLAFGTRVSKQRVSYEASLQIFWTKSMAEVSVAKETEHIETNKSVVKAKRTNN